MFVRPREAPMKVKKPTLKKFAEHLPGKCLPPPPTHTHTQKATPKYTGWRQHLSASVDNIFLFKAFQFGKN